MRLLALRSQSPTKTERYDMMAGLQQHTFHFATLARTHPKILDESHLLLSGIRRNQANSHCFLSSSIVHSLTEKKWTTTDTAFSSGCCCCWSDPVMFLPALTRSLFTVPRPRKRKKENLHQCSNFFSFLPTDTPKVKFFTLKFVPGFHGGDFEFDLFVTSGPLALLSKEADGRFFVCE